MSKATENRKDIDTDGRMKKEFVSPKKAKEYLLHNKANRKIVDAHVANFIGLMNAGEFILSSDPVVFDQNGDLVSGQHRLWAVVISGKGQYFWVLRYAPVALRRIVDRTKSRSFLDNCNRPGFCNSDMAAVRAFYEQPTGSAMRGTGARYLWTDDLIARAIDLTEDALAFVRNHLKARIKYISCAGITSLLMRAWYHVKASDLARFIDVLVDPALSQAGTTDVNAVRLRDFLITNPIDTGWAGKSLIYCRGQFYLQAFKEGRIVKRAGIVEGDIFPILDCMKIPELQRRQIVASDTRKTLRALSKELYGEAS